MSAFTSNLCSGEGALHSVDSHVLRELGGLFCEHLILPCLQLEDVYGQIYKVLKPGALFVTYEWVATDKFNRNNPEHVRIIDEINYGNGLPVSDVQSMGLVTSHWHPWHHILLA
jgi:hypothetical protein